MRKTNKSFTTLKDQVERFNLNVTVIPILIFIACSLLGHMLQAAAAPCGMVDQCSQVNAEIHITH